MYHPTALETDVLTLLSHLHGPSAGGLRSRRLTAETRVQYQPTIGGMTNRGVTNVLHAMLCLVKHDLILQRRYILILRG